MNETQCCESVRKSTAMEVIIKQMIDNQQGVSRVYDRISEYLSRQLGPRPSSSHTEKNTNETCGNIESMNRTLEREKETLNFIHEMLDSLEQIG